MLVVSIMEKIAAASALVSDNMGLSSKPKAKIAIVLGSGLSHIGEDLKKSLNAATLSYTEIPHFVPATVEGHKGEFIYGTLANEVPVFVLSGRLHVYEGHDSVQVIFPIRVLKSLGVETIILTNASGAIADNFEPGQLMVINDHINLTGDSPLIGKNLNELGPRFVDMSKAYDKDLIKVAKTAAKHADIVMHEGTYIGVLGPCYETPAEIRMFKMLGADAVGMSTVFETIAARHLGIKVLGISCLSNKAAGLSSKEITHEEVFDIANKVAKKLEAVLRYIVRNLAR